MKFPLWFSISVSFLSALTAVANGLVIFVIIRRPQLHNTSNSFVLSLAVADFFVGLSFLPVPFLCEIDGHNYSCDHNSVFHIIRFFLTASITNLCCMVADRYISVVLSLRYKELVTSKRVAVVVSVAWLVPGVATAIAVLLGETVKPTDNASWRRAFTLVYFWFFVILPFVFLPIATGHMIFTARTLSRQTADLAAQLNFNHPQGTVMRIRRQARVYSSTVITATVVGCFVLCYSVETYIPLCKTFLKCNLPFILSFFSNVLKIINSLLNPIAYALIKGDIKTELGRLCCHMTSQAQTSHPVSVRRSQLLQTSSL